MRYHDITTDDMNNGDGLRTVLWVAGCTHHCEDCQNPITWDLHGGVPFDGEAEQELFEKLSKPYISGITFSGGDPLHPENRAEVFRLISAVRDQFPEKTVWLYTGYLWEQIAGLPAIALVDVVVDGPFLPAQKDVKLHWRGSANQRVIAVKPTLETGSVVLHDAE